MNGMLDGDAITVGDTIFDMFLGTGRVTHTASDGAFTATFSARQLRYAPGGKVSGVKRAYWHDPVLVTPRKNDDAQWALYQRLIQATKG